MRRYLSTKLLGIMFLASFLMITPHNVFAQEDFGLDEETPAASPANDKTESDVINDICKRMCGSDEKFGDASLKEVNMKGKKILVPVWFKENAKKDDENPDPFRPVIRKEVNQIVKQQVVKPVETKKNTPPPPPPPKPIKIFVKGIVGNEGSRLAIVEFEKEEMTITKDQIVEGKFKVVDIYADRVVVYSNKEQRRHTFKIGGDEK